MTKIITDKVFVNNYLLSKNKADSKASNTKKEAVFNRRRVELEIAMDPEEREYRDKDRVLAELIGHELVHTYPGHGWQVECDIRNGIAKVFNCHMSGLHGYLMHLKDLSLDTFRDDIMRVGGTLLESFGIGRGHFDQDEIMSIQRDHSGSAKADF